MDTNNKTDSVEAIVLDYQTTLERMAAGNFSGTVSHDIRREFERVVRKHSPRQIVEWNCNCDSVLRMARIILTHEIGGYKW
jgi:hypothetical protein